MSDKLHELIKNKGIELTSKEELELYEDDDCEVIEYDTKDE